MKILTIINDPTTIDLFPLNADEIKSALSTPECDIIVNVAANRIPASVRHKLIDMAACEAGYPENISANTIEKINQPLYSIIAHDNSFYLNAFLTGISGNQDMCFDGDSSLDLELTLDELNYIQRIIGQL